MAAWKPSTWKEVRASVHAAHRITQANAMRLREAADWQLTIGWDAQQAAEPGILLIMPDGEQFFSPVFGEYPEPIFADPRPKESPAAVPSKSQP